MKTVLGIEVGIVAAVMLVLWLTAPGPGQPDGDGPALTLTVENGEMVLRPMETPQAIMAPYVIGSGALLAVMVPLAMRRRRRPGERA